VDSAALFDKVRSLPSTLGVFDQVNGHEPKKAPGHGLTCAVWLDRIGPDPRSSGLNSSTARLAFMIRVYQNMLAEPQDAIDPAVLEAIDLLITGFSASVTFNNTLICIDLLGMSGDPMGAQAGYVNQDGRLFRCMTLTLPLLVDNAWPQIS
jgi:hypothetical protein